MSVYEVSHCLCLVSKLTMQLKAVYVLVIHKRNK